MKKLFLPIFLFASMAFSAGAAVIASGDANVYAYDLKVVSGSEVSFKLNAVPTAVKVNFYKSGEVVHSVELSADELAAVVAGKDVTVTLSDVSGVEKGESLTWEVVAGGEGHSNIIGFSDYASSVAEKADGATVTEEICTAAAKTVSDDQKMEFPYSVAVDNCPTSPNFGNIYMLNMSDADLDWGVTDRGQGLLVYNPDLTLAATATMSNVNPRIAYFSKSSSQYVPLAPYAVAVDEEGYVYVSNNSGTSNGGGIYVASPSDLTTFDLLISVPSGQYFQDLVVVGKGENKVLYVLGESTQSVLKYAIGDMTAGDYTAETFADLATATDYVSTSYTLNSMGSYPARLCSDKNGGLWAINGNMSSYANGYFLLNHISEGGVLDYYVYDYYGYYSGDYAATAKRFYDIETNVDGSELAVAICGSIIPFTVTFGNVPSLAEGSVYVKGATSSTAPYGREGNPLNGVVTGVAYDVAGNIIATDLSGYFQAFAMPNAENTYTTPANAEIQVSEAVLTGVAEVAVDANAPVEYYNLQGVKVTTPENGLFIKKQGGIVTKVIL